MNMPFGKHKGQEIHTIPHDYLLWLKGNVDLWGDLMRAVEAGLEGKAFMPPTSEERVDEARRKMLERLRQREMAK